MTDVYMALSQLMHRMLVVYMCHGTAHHLHLHDSAGLDFHRSRIRVKRPTQVVHMRYIHGMVLACSPDYSTIY